MRSFVRGTPPRARPVDRCTSTRAWCGGTIRDKSISAGGCNFKHFNFKLIDALQGHQQQLGILGSDLLVAKWHTPQLVTDSKMGITALELISR